MNFRNPKMALPALIIALTLLLAAEWVLPATTLPSRRFAAIPASGPDASADAAIGQWAGTILARPVFSQNRRPAAQANSAAVQPLPRLCAIIIAGGSRSAVFSTPGQKPLVVGQGGEIGAYQLKTITINHVDLLAADGSTTTLRPQFLTPVQLNVANSSP